MELQKPILYGSLSGGIGYISTLPLDYIKQHLQTQKSFALVRKDIVEQGFRTMFRGGVLGLYSIIPQMAIKFTTFDILQKLDQKNNTKTNTWKNGFIAGFVDGAFLGPILSIQSMQQMNHTMTYKTCMKQLFSNYRYTHHLLYPMALRNAFYTSILFGSSNMIKDRWQKQEYSFLDNLMIASLGNIPAVLMCSFADVLRANQITQFLKNEKYDIYTISRALYKTHGSRWMFRGLSGLYINFALRFPFTYALYQSFIHM